MSTWTSKPACSRSKSRARAATRWLSGISSMTMRRVAWASSAIGRGLLGPGPCMYVQHDGMFFGHTDEPIEAGQPVQRRLRPERRTRTCQTPPRPDPRWARPEARRLRPTPASSPQRCACQACSCRASRLWRPPSGCSSRSSSSRAMRASWRRWAICSPSSSSSCWPPRCPSSPSTCRTPAATTPTSATPCTLGLAGSPGGSCSSTCRWRRSRRRCSCRSCSVTSSRRPASAGTSPGG